MLTLSQRLRNLQISVHKNCSATTSSVHGECMPIHRQISFLSRLKKVFILLRTIFSIRNPAIFLGIEWLCSIYWPLLSADLQVWISFVILKLVWINVCSACSHPISEMLKQGRIFICNLWWNSVYRNEGTPSSTSSSHWTFRNMWCMVLLTFI